MNSVVRFDKSLYYLGKVCLHGHDWHGTGSSLRRRKKRDCMSCRREADADRTDRGGGKASRQRLRVLANQIKLDRGCADCGFREHPAALEFDHLPGTTKRFGVARLINSGQLGRFLAEIALCEVVCANCHRMRTAKRAGW